MFRFKAYKKWETENIKDLKFMPGINLTTDQMFFLSYGQVCLMLIIIFYQDVVL